MNVKLDEGAKLPTKAHLTDAGFDIYSREDKFINPKSSACFDTGVHIEIPQGFVGFLKSKNGLNVKNSIQSEGVIDCGYTDSIVVKLYNHGSERYKVNKGDKISQLVILPILETSFNIVDELNNSERGDNGFGSTGK